MNFKNLTTTAQGNIGLGAAIAYFTSKQMIVCLPLNDNQPYDLVIDELGILKKVQIKTTGYMRNKTYVVQLKTVKPNRTMFKTELFDNVKSDYIFALTEESVQYLIPSSVIDSKYEICLGDKYKKYIVTN